MPETLTAEELVAMRHLAQVTPYLGEAVDEIERLKASETAGISIFNEAVEALKGKTVEIDSLRREKDYWKERTRIYTEAAASVGVAFASDGTAGNLEAERLKAELATAQEDTDRLDWLWGNGWIDAWDNDGYLTPRQAIDAARKESR